MQLEKVLTLFDSSPVIRLLKAETAPFVIHFLQSSFKKENTVELEHEELKLKLLIYVEDVQQTWPTSLTGSVDRYLAEWCDKGWLSRHLQSASNEPLYQLTQHSEEAIHFVDNLLTRRSEMVGTESRLRLIMDTLDDLVRGASANRDDRLRHLRAKRDEIQRQIEAVENGKPVEVYRPAQIRERFGLAVGLLKTLQSDFRAVQDRFHQIARGVQQDQHQTAQTRGQILGGAMDAEDLLKTEDEGISFYAFIAFLFSPDSQQQLRQTIEKVIQLKDVQDQRDALDRLRNMVRSLLRESDKVLKNNAELSTSLRKLLDTETVETRRQTAEVLTEIKQLAAKLRDEPTSIDGISVQLFGGVQSPLSRSFWSTPATFDDTPEENVVDLSKTDDRRSAFAALQLLDLESLRDVVTDYLRDHSDVRLSQIIDDHPLEGGVIELIGYLQIAFDDGHQIDHSQIEEVTVAGEADGQMVRVRIPQTTFQRSAPGVTAKHKPR